MRARAWLDDLRLDLIYGFRSLRRRPGLLLTALLTLGLGIGAAVAMFSVLNLALFRALPFPDADRLVVGRTIWPSGNVGWMSSGPDFESLRDESASYESMATITPFTGQATVTGGDEPQRVALGWMSPGLMRTIGAPMHLGREFTAEEAEQQAPVAVLSGRFWRTRLGGDPDIVGSSLTLEGQPVTVIGITPPDFRFVNDAEVLRPMGDEFGPTADFRQFHNWLIVGRLRPGATADVAQSEADVIMAHLAQAYPESNRNKGMLITPLQEAMVERFRPTLLMLTGAIALVLLIACGNVAGLLLARGSTRGTELAMRTALGAPRVRIVQQLLTESVPLALAAGALGTVIALLLQRTLVAATPLNRLALESTGLQPEVLVFAFALSLVTVLAFGLAPALIGSRVQLADELKAGSRTVSGGKARFRAALVVGQVALSVVLLVGATLLIRSYLRLASVDPGFSSARVLTADVSLLSARYPEDPERIEFYRRFLEEAKALPEVEEAGLINRVPIREAGGNTAAWNPENPPADAAENQLVYGRTVTASLHAALGVPELRGRRFAETDTEAAEPVVIISESAARTLYPDVDPIGRELVVDEGEEARYRIVGVVGDIVMDGLDRDRPMAMYFPYAQRAGSGMRLVLRTRGEPTAVVGQLREILRRLDPDIPLAHVASMEEVIHRSTSFDRTIVSAAGLFAAVALFMAALGLYGVLAYHVQRRTHEIGIRMALGARVAHILGMVVGQGFALVGLGLAIGVVAAFGIARLIRDLLFGVEAADPVTFAVVVAFFSLVALLACLLPAWRAWRVDPVTAFRTE